MSPRKAWGSTPPDGVSDAWAALGSSSGGAPASGDVRHVPSLEPLPYDSDCSGAARRRRFPIDSGPTRAVITRHEDCSGYRGRRGEGSLIRPNDAPGCGRRSCPHADRDRRRAGGQLLYEYDGDEKQIPASTMKVVTAATSLTALGVQTRFPTSVVQGDSASEIILVGGGDPLLSRGDINKLAGKTAKVLRKRGTTSVSLAVDDYLFPSPSDAPGWEPGDSPT
ncbi:MAG: D-alanyl-D-alanine carboxypeptidase, partial [Candidatus Nanopelagicales bacterium]